MKPLRLLFLLILAGTAPLAQAQNQGEMNQQAAASFAKADQQLNALYKKALAGLDEESKAKLKAAQRAWVAFRDAEAEFHMQVEAGGGSMAAMIYEGTRARLTKARIAELREFLANHAGR